MVGDCNANVNKFDIILSAETIYSECMYERLHDLIDTALAPDGLVFWLQSYIILVLVVVYQHFWISSNHVANSIRSTVGRVKLKYLVKSINPEIILLGRLFSVIVSSAGLFYRFFILSSISCEHYEDCSREKEYILVECCISLI
uniref:Methyltranfer_dom domain-containing protein n=1 Tax=Ascaris lumbricoides TaxID=6252 RepID=A0A0M3IXG2_ASCLU